MMSKTVRLLAVACMLLFALSCTLIVVEDKDENGENECQKQRAKPYKHGKTDIYADDVGDFLNVDLKEIKKQAYEAYQAEEYEKSAELYLKLLRYDVKAGDSMYNLACCYGLLGKARHASEFIEKSFDSGFRNVEWMKNDPDFKKVKDTDVFKDVIARLEEKAKEKEEGKGDTFYISASAEFRYRIKFPEGYDESKSYPLLVGLHGYGSDPESFVGLYERFDNPQFIYAVPQAPYPYMRGNEQGYSWSAPVPDEDPASERSKLESEEYVAKLVKHLQSEYKVGDTYLLGFSQGCGMTYTIGIKNHELFKGLVCFGGWFSEDWLVKKAGIDLKKMNDLRIFIAHGSKDEMVKFEEGTKARDILKKLGYDVKFYEFDGAHAVPKEALLEVQKWMSQ
ncbi:hypothetical protein J7M28_03425 [bacterium]|nr:hypothetical protein [bacterium]